MSAQVPLQPHARQSIAARGTEQDVRCERIRDGASVVGGASGGQARNEGEGAAQPRSNSERSAVAQNRREAWDPDVNGTQPVVQGPEQRSSSLGRSEQAVRGEQCRKGLRFDPSSLTASRSPAQASWRCPSTTAGLKRIRSGRVRWKPRRIPLHVEGTLDGMARPSAALALRSQPSKSTGRL